MTTRDQDEILEAVWLAAEQGWEPTVDAVVERAHGSVRREDLDLAVSDGLLRIDGDVVVFEPAGELEAVLIVRRHRLAERLLADVLQVSGGVVESSACEFEHVLSPELTDSICTLLGHPTVCPHLQPIPPGPCCSRLAKEIGPLIRRLADVTVGEKVRVVFIASDQEKRLERLGSLGVLPGSVLRLVQRRPSYVLDVDQTTLAVEQEVADGIYVKRWVPENDHANGPRNR
jgi:DtxR family Mn-dependent transcriptional regulator